MTSTPGLHNHGARWISKVSAESRKSVQFIYLYGEALYILTKLAR